MTSGGERKPVNPRQLPAWALPAAMAILTLGLFGDCLLIPGRVPAGVENDLRSQYLPWRQFAFTQIAHGRFPLWNPFIFCGTPFFGDPQSAMLYPPNWLHLILSPARAASWLFVIHFFLAGYFAGLWCRWRGNTDAAAILAGAVYACCGPIVTNIAAGHLPLLCSAAWAPLLMGCVERVFSDDRPASGRAILIGIAAVAMLALDGYPQFAYYCALASGLFALLLSLNSKRLRRGAAAVLIIFAGGGFIAAVQIIASMQFAAESVRAGGLSISDAANFSLPPENLLTLAIPGIFGDTVGMPYYGRWFWWEASVFVGPTALALAWCGLAKDRRAIAPAVAAVVMFLLALGDHTPLFSLLFHYLPGFHDFRATARFGLLGILFLSVLVAAGFDRLPQAAADPHVRRRVLRLSAACGLLGTAAGLAAIYATGAESNGPGAFTRLVDAIRATGQSFLLTWTVPQTFVEWAADFAARQLATAAAVILVTAGLLFSAVRRPSRKNAAWITALALFAVAQLIWFAMTQRSTSDHPMPPRLSWRNALASVPDDGRVMLASAWFADHGAIDGFLNINGYNPLMLRRTARYLAKVLDQSEDSVGQNDPSQVNERLCRLLRGTWVMPARPGAAAYPLSDPLPRMLLMDHVQLAAGPDAALAAVLNDSFDPARTVMLESAPSPMPEPSADAGQVRLLRETTDELEIVADLPAPRLLLITDAYSTGWHAFPLDAGDRQTYQVLPADICLRAVPLSAGHHHFLLAYRPAGIVAGMWISLLALIAYLALWVLHLRG